MNGSMKNELDDVLKECLMQDIQVVGEKVYKKIAGLTNLGRTYFCFQREINDKNKYAQDQMINKYGAETYGISAQQKNPDSSIDKHDSLISCKCNGFLQIPEKYKQLMK